MGLPSVERSCISCLYQEYAWAPTAEIEDRKYYWYRLNLAREAGGCFMQVFTSITVASSVPRGGKRTHGI